MKNLSLALLVVAFLSLAGMIGCNYARMQQSKPETDTVFVIDTVAEEDASTDTLFLEVQQ